MDAGDNASEFLIAEGNDDADADCGRFGLVIHAVGEDAVERDWQGYVAEVGHDVQFVSGQSLSSAGSHLLTPEEARLRPQDLSESRTSAFGWQA